MKDKVNRILSIFLVIIICFPALNASATQSRGGNFNKNYTLNGNPADNIVAVAQAQQGKTKAQLGYTEAWCADFVSDCAKLAGQGDVIPFNGSCQYLYNNVKNAGGRDVSSPKKGDLVFYYCSKCQVHWCHVGLMIDSQRSIEGNYGGKVSLVNGAYRDSAGHSLSNGIVTRKFVTPAYKNNTPTLITPQLSLSAGTNNYEKGQDVAFNWTWGGSEADGYNLFIAKNIAGTNEYDWENAQRAFFPGNETTSGVIYAPVFESGGAYAVYAQACAPNDKRSGKSNFVYFTVKSGKPQCKLWISRTKMGDEADVVPAGKECYLCYQVLDKETQQNWDELYKNNYQVKETFTDPDGETYSCTYTNDNNWISITPDKAGKYKGTAEVSGDFSGKVECDFIVKKFYYGDINGDDDITVTDLAMANQAVNKNTVLNADQKKRADVNADGAITEEDVTLIKEYILGTITEFPAESHVHSYNSKVTKNATCTSTGVRTYSCICGESYTETISRISHTLVTDQAVAATCTKQGKTEGSHCSVCGAVLAAQKTIAATGHVHTELRNVRTATTLATGYTGDTYCTDCGAKISSGKVIEKIKNETQEGDKTDANDPSEDKKTDEDDKENDEEDDVLEVGDMLYDTSGKAEYKVIKITRDTVFVSYNATLKKKQKVIIVPNQIKTEDGIICKVTAVSERAFYNYKYVKQIILGSNITRIGTRAFTGCQKLSSLTIKSSKITSKYLSSKAFKGISSKTKIKVPRAKRNSYKKLFYKKGLSKRVKVCNM